ncbi:carboxymuconolactone decarboxylase family protein [Foetidibacter luteolus]|uniref:carboxymuconolactone decarboxylase family protein n=1 Tax=Foetidibacter luteolus TaxID=2608880 RepID=UPI00129B3A49|nr:peroxidase-related enzyme [Foetidibacter luteolus]
MPHIKVNEDLPGIRALLAFSPSTAAPIGELADLLLRSNEGLSMAERELIATYVSYLNDCFYCHHSHGEIAVCYLDGDRATVDQVRNDYTQANIPAKLKALLNIAGHAQKGGKYVTAEDVAFAKSEGATDKDIHDTVLITALFCMFNRYVDGLAANTPKDLSTYPARAKQIAEKGYGSHVYTQPAPVAV